MEMRVHSIECEKLGMNILDGSSARSGQMIQQWPGVILFSAFVVLPALFSTVQKTDSEQTSRNKRRPALRIALSEFADSKHELNRCVKCVSVSFVEDDLLALTLATSVSPSRAQA
jgi:hypothetical protein